MSQVNQDRMLTIVVKIKEPEKANWIWDGLKGERVNGVDMIAVSNGNLYHYPLDVQAALDALDRLSEREARTILEEAQEKKDQT
jgi:hypothetical protein